MQVRSEAPDHLVDLRTGPKRSRGIAWFDDLDADDVSVAGGKGANLGEMTQAGLPVPDGFVVLASEYLASMAAAGVRDEINRRFADAQTDVRPVDQLLELASCMNR